MKITLKSAYSFSGLGHRKNQEDSRYPDTDSIAAADCQRCYLVCDGVGGEAKGEVASRVAADAIGQYIDGIPFDRPFTEADLSIALARGYEAIDIADNGERNRMATTMTLVVFHPGGATVSHIGDSRIYQIRPGVGIRYRSEDHSLVNALVRTGNITPEEAPNHPMSNDITRCMTSDPKQERHNATTITLPDVAPGDVFILASDGVLHCVDDRRLVEIVSSELPDADKCEILRRESEDSTDNNTLWMVTVADVEGVVTPREVIVPDGCTRPLPKAPDSTADVAPAQRKSFIDRLAFWRKKG